jgi:general nucleoside transport system permease protein
MAVSATTPSTAASPRVSSETLAERSHLLRSRLYGVAFIVLALVIYWLFARGVDTQAISTYGLNQGNVAAADRLPDWVVPSFGTAALLAAASAAIGAYQLARGFGRATSLMLGLVALFFIFAFLTWATRGQSINLAGMLKTMVERAVPLVLGALSGILCERAGVINIAIEGLMLGAAMTAALFASISHNLWVGVLAALITGAVLAYIHAVLSIKYRVDQIISGTVINIFATGMTSFISSKFLQVNQNLNTPGIFDPFPIPLLSKIPLLGPMLFNSNIFTYGAYILLIVVHVGLFYTRWGLRVRAVGEHPRAADTLGINVYRVRYVNVILGGLVAGFGGAYFTLGSVGRFDELMTAGRGFIALAAMIFGKWTPFGSAGAALIFGLAESLQTKLSILQVPIPSQFLLMAPYIVTMIALAGLIGRATPPAADGIPYEKD